MDEDKNTWDALRNAVLSSIIPDYDGNLLPEDTPLVDKIILLELARETAIDNGLSLAALESRKDFAEWVADRRPDPTREQWMWLYRNIGPRHQDVNADTILGIMAGRDALLPFLRSAPDSCLVECYEKFFEGDEENVVIGKLPYPQLEDAIKEDSSAKLGILRIMNRNVTDEDLMLRAVELEKPAVVCSLLKSLSPERQLPKLIKILRHWSKREELLAKVVESFGDDLLASWHDEYGNGFFWYLYAHENPVSPAMIQALPDAVIAATFERPNRYRIAPSDLWRFYREGLNLLGEVPGG